MHKKPMDLQRIPKDTKKVHRQDVSRQPMEEQEIPNQQEHQDTGKVDRLNKGQLERKCCAGTLVLSAGESAYSLFECGVCKNRLTLDRLYLPPGTGGVSGEYLQ